MKKLNKFLSLILAVCLLMGMMALPVSAATENTAGISKDKTAQWHDDPQTIADVTLSVPGEYKQLGVDIIYVLGGFLAADKVESNLMINSLMETFAEIIATGTPVNFGMVPFSYTDKPVMELTTFASAEDLALFPAKVAQAIIDAGDVYGGENMENALVVAKKMLSESDLADHPERQHLVLVSTGHTFNFNSGENNELFSTVPVAIDNSGDYNKLFFGAKAWMQARNYNPNTYPIPKAFTTYNDYRDWDAYWAEIEKWAAADVANGDQYVYAFSDTTSDSDTYYDWYMENVKSDKTHNNDTGLYKSYGIYFVGSDELVDSAVHVSKGSLTTSLDNVPASAKHAISYERAMWEANNFIKKEITGAGINFYPIYNPMKAAYSNGYDGTALNCTWTKQYIGHSFMNMLAGGEAVIYDANSQKDFFDPIKNEILYTCAAGSYVEDFIGYENNANDGFNFDFLVDGKITLTVGTTEYTTAKLETAKEGFDASYTFTAPGAAEATFTLDYVKGNGTTEEKFIWTFGEDIQTFAPAKLNYQVKLVECRMPEGTAAEGYLVKTNQNAMLYPVGGEAEAFPIPELTVLPMYTVTYEYVGVIPENAPEVPAAKDYVVGTKVDTAAAPELEGYDFFGWNNPHTNDVTFDMPAHDITITGYWLPVNDHIDPPIGIKTDKEKGEGYQYDVTISVPGDGEEVKIHDEVILIIDASYSCDEEWADMKANIIEIGKHVLGGVGRTQMTVISFGMGDYVVAEGVKTVEDLTALLPELPGGLLYGRSSTNCESGFTGAMEYIQSKESELSKVDVIYISDFGVNTDETERVFDDWQTLATKFGPLTVAQAAFEGALTYGENLPAAFSVFGDRFDGMTGEEILTVAFTNGEVTDEEFLAFAEQLWTDVYAYSGLTRGEEYPVSTVERAFVKYDKENGTYIQDAFYYTTYNSKYVTYNDRWNRSTEAGKLLAAMPIVNELYMVRYGNHAQGWWAKNVTGAKYYSADSVAGLLEVLKPMTEELSQTNYTNVVITDYMSKWVLLHTDSIYVQNDTTGEIIWTIKDGWLSETDRPTSKTPVTCEKVDPADYAAGGADVIGNTNGDIYKLTWNVKDDCLLRTDNYSLHYVVTVDIDEPGFVPGQEFPANGNTFVDYEVGGHNDIQVPDVTIPAYTVTYLNGQIQLQKTEAHKTGDEIPACETPASYTENGYRYTFARWSLRSGVEGENNTVGNTDLVYEAVYTATLDETQVTVEKIWDDDDDFEGARPENITIRLFANGEEVAVQVVTAEDGWTYTFENLPIYANDEVIVYTVTEDAVEGYEMIELRGDAENGFKIVNQYLIVVDDPEPPTTGDPIALVLALSVISVLGMAVIVLQRKKFN